MRELDPVYYWFFLLAAVLCYLIGSFNFAVLISKIKKRDIRSQGSGNPGTMNMTRTFGVKIGIINLVCDIVKGGIPAVVAWIIYKDYYFAGTTVAVADFMRYFCGMFVIIGHIFPITMHFKGGKGIASTIGLFLFALPCEEWWYFPVALCVLAVVIVYVIFFELGSIGSLVGVTSFSVWQAALFVTRYFDVIMNVWVIAMLLIILVINLLTWIAHHKNIYKLLAGEEHRTKIRKRHKSI